MTLEITVRLSCGAHVTNTVRGMRASSTMSAEAAAARLGQKLFGPSFRGAKQQAHDRDPQVERWLLNADEKWYAWCWASGLIHVGPELPGNHEAGMEGPVVFASGPERALKESIAVLSRHGQGASAGCWLVPGVPEAKGQRAAMTALIKWKDWAAMRNGKPNSHGVVFGRLEEL